MTGIDRAVLRGCAALALVAALAGCDDATTAAWNSALTDMNSQLQQQQQQPVKRDFMGNPIYYGADLPLPPSPPKHINDPFYVGEPSTPPVGPTSFGYSDDTYSSETSSAGPSSSASSSGGGSSTAAYSGGGSSASSSSGGGNSPSVYNETYYAPDDATEDTRGSASWSGGSSSSGSSSSGVSASSSSDSGSSFHLTAVESSGPSAEEIARQQEETRRRDAEYTRNAEAERAKQKEQHRLDEAAELQRTRACYQRHGLNFDTMKVLLPEC